MNKKFSARLSNAVISKFAWFVKFTPSWAYRFTKVDNIYSKKKNVHTDKFLLGKDKELNLIKKLLAKGVSVPEIRSHLWSADTVLETLKDNKIALIFAGNFVDYVPTKSQFDAVLQSKSLDAIKAACAQSKYTPSEEHILPIAAKIYPMPNDINMTRPDFMDIFETIVKRHSSAFTEKLLNKLDTNLQSLFLQLAIEGNKVAPEQVEWALTHSGIAGAKEFIEQFYHLMPATPECAKRLRAYSRVLFDTWCRTQTAATLCKCCLTSWVTEKNEQYLRLIEEKAYIHNDSDSAIQLVKSTNKFVFQHAIECIVQQNASEAHLLPYVAEDNRWYQTMVRQILNHSAKIKYLTENQVAKLSDEQRNTYWKNMALCNHISAHQYAKLPDGELKNEVAQIMENNAMISWFQKNHEINERTLSEFGDRELSDQVQYWLANNGYLAWLVYYFSGAQITEAAKIAFGWDWRLQKNDTKHHLSTAAFKKLVDDDRTQVIRAYLYVYKNILPAKREYLLCSPMKHMAVGIGTR